MKQHRNNPARPEQVAVNNQIPQPAKQDSSHDDARESEAAARQAQEGYPYNLECLVAQAFDKSRLEVGKTLIQKGAVTLNDNPDYFDQSGRITASGLDAIVAGGMGHVWRKWREAMLHWRGLTLFEINAIREVSGVPPIGQERKIKS